MALQAWGKDREKEKDQKWRGRGRRPELGGGEAVQFRALEGDRVTERGASKSGSRAGEDWGGGVSWESHGLAIHVGPWWGTGVCQVRNWSEDALGGDGGVDRILRTIVEGWCVEGSGRRGWDRF